MAGTWDFCPNSMVAQEIPPEPTKATSFNGWEFTSRPSVPYRRTFKVKIHGLRWYMNDAMTVLDKVTDPTHNAGRLLDFYRERQTWDTFTYPHQYLGNITCKFHQPLVVPPGMEDSNGLVPEFEIMLIHHNPGY